MNGNHSVYSTNVTSPHSYTPFTLDHNTNNDSSEIQCICGFHHDDGFTIQCDQCDTWQHGYCVDIAHDAVPEKYECPNCRPRPVDIRRARDYQQNVNDREKPRRKKIKSTSTSNASRKKDASSNIIQNNAPGTSTLADRAGSSGKTNAPKEFTSSRKRGSNRASVSTKIEPNNIHFLEPTNGAFVSPVGAVTSSAPSPVMTEADRIFEGDSDTDMEKPQAYKYDFTDITDGEDHYVSREVQYFVNQMKNSTEDKTIRWLTIDDVALPGLSVVSLPGKSHPYSRLQHLITVDSLCQSGQLVALCKGEISYKDTHRSNSVNQFFRLRHPKAFVFFHPSQNICVDARIRGSISRFVKRSCRPNTTLATLVIDDKKVVFGFFAIETIAADSTLTVGWDWACCRSAQKILNGMEVEQLEDDEYQDALSWTNTLTEEWGECACVYKDECVFYKLNQIEKRESSPLKQPSRVRRCSRATQGHSSAPGSKQASPEHQINSDRDDGSRSSKSRSRDLSPQLQPDGGMSSRDTRKLQGLLSRFEKIEQGNQSAGNKRRKRNNTVSAPTVTTSESIIKAEIARKSKSSSTVVSPPSYKDVCDMAAPSLSMTRKSPDSLSVTSDEARIHMQPPPAPIRRLKKLEYVDAAMQTDKCDDDWWNIPAPETSPVPTRVSVKERLKRAMLRERETWEARKESRKRKQSEISDSCPSPAGSYKEKKECDVFPTPQKSPQQMDTADIPMEDGPRELVNTPPEPSDETPMTSVSPSDVKPVEPVLPAEPRGPALANTFADSSPTDVLPQEPVMDDKRTPPVSPMSTTIDLPHAPFILAGRPAGLRVQLPTGPIFPTAPATPAQMPPLTSSPPSANPRVRPQSPSASLAAQSKSPTSMLPVIASQISQMNSISTPTKPKKLSLSEYGRRKKVDHTDKKAMMSAVSEEVSNNSAKGGPDAASPTAFA